ncbi:hypothetical protein [Ferviditalea candida]|uniref:Uncharacterized protein n=1 Tax=Ferviditalea candida TaxID=3108399 RepID=A0ABU5ZN47_9BACL|nr:hypothetical protein [Paenibacillaceae bacterium T2]
MYAITSGGGCFCPTQPPVCYGIGLSEEGEMMPSLELVGKQKNGFGDTIYYIRDQNGTTNMIHESRLSDFLKKNGVSVLKEGDPFKYSTGKNK